VDRRPRDDATFCVTLRPTSPPWARSFIPLMSGTVTAPPSCRDGRDDCFHSSNALPMADMPETRCARRLAHGDMAVANRQAFRCCRLRGLAQTLGLSNELFAWISRNRRLARDFERYATTVVAFVRFAAQAAARCRPLDTHSNMQSIKRFDDGPQLRDQRSPNFHC
jgi:hypothetical protein